MKYAYAPLVLFPIALSLAPACSSTSATADAGADAAAIPPAAGGTGAFGIVTVNGIQKLYLPLSLPSSLGNGIVAVVNVGLAGNGANGAPALITDIDLGSPGDLATTTGGNADIVVAASTISNKVWFIDPKTDTLTKTITLDSTYGTSSFSGGGGYVTGIAIDSANHRAILSVWNGFAIVDLNTQAITSVIQAPPSENFGFDSVHQRIIAPFYDCSSSSNATASLTFCGTFKTPTGDVISEGLNIIDLSDNTVYTYQDPTATNPAAPVGSEPDSAAADPTTGVIVVPSEGGGFQNIIDLSQATFDKNAKTVTAPHKQLEGNGLTGVAVEFNKHYAFWEEEGSSEVAVADLAALNSGGTDNVQATMPDLPATAGSWSNMGDPHGIAVTTAIQDGSSVGFLVNGERTWVARVDLAKMLALPHDDAGTFVTNTALAPVVTYLDARTKP